MLQASVLDMTVQHTPKPRQRVRLDSPDVSPALRGVFEAPIARALAGRAGGYDVRLERGREAREILVLIRATGRRQPLSLYFPEADSLTAEDVERIVRNVLEGMGPLFP